MSENTENTCKGNHTGHLCVLSSEKKMDEIRELVGNPRYMCFNCARVANEAVNLCNPMALKD